MKKVAEQRKPEVQSHIPYKGDVLPPVFLCVWFVLSGSEMEIV